MKVLPPPVIHDNEGYNLHHCHFGFESFKVRFRHNLRPQLLPRRGQGPLCNTQPGPINNFEAHYDVIVVLPELSKGEVCALRHLKQQQNRVLVKSLIRNRLLVHGLQDTGGVGWHVENLYKLELFEDVIFEVRWVSRCTKIIVS